LSTTKEESEDNQLEEEESTTTTSKQSETIITTEATPKIEEMDKDKQQPTTIDFLEMENVPYKPISPSSFYDSCKSITQYQIPREIQMESAMKYSQLLQIIPQHIMDYAATKLLSSSKDEDHDDKPDLSILSDNSYDDVLDMSLKDAITEVTTLKKSMQIQYNDRHTILQNLYACKCKFDANKIANEYYNVNEMLNLLSKKKDILEDAMELEGVDVDEIKNKNHTNATADGKNGNNDDNWKDLNDFDWFVKEEEDAATTVGNKANVEKEIIENDAML